MAATDEDAVTWGAKTRAEIERLEGLADSERQRAERAETALRGLLPLAQERAKQFREYADRLAKFAKETVVTPSDAVEASLKLRRTEAEGAELVVERARAALKEAGHAA